MKPRIVALYLPQFHSIPENDEWWGKGFTDWTNVRKAKPLFNGHAQPRVPLSGNYYDLSDVDVLRWQSSLAEKYGISGFCFYHYWFAGGKKLLEKPAEMLLQTPDIPMQFCFSWANEPWARTWDGKGHKVLMPQEYGDKEDWRKHFDYLLPFFRDSRYMKVNGKPMFVIYKTRSIPCCLEMMNAWIEWTKEAGLPGIHFVETLRDGNIDQRQLPISARMEFEPARTDYQIPIFDLYYRRVRRRVVRLMNKVFGTNIMHNTNWTFDYISQRAIRNMSPEGTYGGAFVGWDNSARRGLAATIIEPPTRDQFRSYLSAVMEKTEKVYHTDYVFINAWNEWAEGTYLEPDEDNKYAYLEVIRELTTTQ